MLQKILRFLDYIIKGSYKAGGNKHIFTDQELYEEYNLTDEEINIIESVIKERKYQYQYPLSCGKIKKNIL